MIKRTYLDYIQDIINSIEEIESFIEGMPFNEFKKDRKTINAVIRDLEIIGEAAKNIPKSIRNNYSQVSWKGMTGMRDKLIHEYSGINLDIVWKTIKEDIPKEKPLLKKIERVLKEEE